ncbi:MAG: tricarboxylate transporter, partial [Rhodobacterales bacterium]|nr:tricarboxylate transporter [Rhodobacterales bacterium]
MSLYKLTRRSVIAVAAAAAIAAPAQADVDMSGKTIEWTIPFSETGGS